MSIFENALNVAACATGMQANDQTEGCAACTKMGLPILLARPSLADKAYQPTYQPVADVLFSGVAQPALSYFTYCARTLRKGYVHVYYEKQHTAEIKAQNGWQLFEVGEGGYLTPLKIGQEGANESFACVRTAGYAGGMLFAIPDAKNTKRVWVGYSDHLWSDKVRQQYAGDESLRNKRMTCINAPAATCERSLAMTTDHIDSIVDYSNSILPTRNRPLIGTPYPRLAPKGTEPQQEIDRDAFYSEMPDAPLQRYENAADIIGSAQATLDAGSGDYTLADAMIVGVPDPIGITHEAAFLRVSLCNSAAKFIQDYPNKEGVNRLVTAQHIEGLLKLYDKQCDEESKKAAPYIHFDGMRVYHSQFTQMKASGELPDSAGFMYATKSAPGTAGIAGVEMKDITGKGFIDVRTPAGIRRDADKKKKQLREKLTAGPKGLTYEKFLQKFKDKASQDHERLKAVEKDYLAWLKSDARKLVTTYDFDEATLADGVAYCECVASLTYGGYLTDKGLEVFQKFVQTNPADPENLFVRNLLGNIKDNFEGFSTATAVSALALFASYLDKLTPERRQLLNAAIQSTITHIGAVSAAAPSKLSTGLRDNLAVLLGKTGSQAFSGSPPALLKVRINVSEAAYWMREQARMGQKIVRSFSRSGDRQIKSLLLGGGMMLETSGRSRIAAKLDDMVDLYVWVKRQPDEIKQLSGKGGYLLETASANLNKSWQSMEGSIRINASQLRKLFHEQFDLVRTSTGIAASAAGVLSLWSMYDTWKSLDTLTGEDRQLAMIGLVSSGLGAASAFLDIGQVLLRKALTRGWQRLSGYAAVVASLVAAVQAGYHGYLEGMDGDDDVRNAYIVQTLVFTLSAVVTYLGIASASLLILGVGAAIFLFGVIAIGLIIALLQDTRAQTWAAKSIWGASETKWGGLDATIAELNELMLGFKVEFDYRSPVVEGSAIGIIASTAVAPVWVVDRLVGNEPREAFCKVVLPQKLRDDLGWEINLIANRKDGKKALVASSRHPENSTLGLSLGQKKWQVDDRDAVAHTPPKEEDKNTFYLSAQLNTAIYSGVYAQVLVDVTPSVSGGLLVNQEIH